ncbi:Gfo/Idh/MocA family protein [Paenibacillus ginsengarvi]|uniref:Gfo/Idh/MocA family oxidoreductase n=1 Tax=Paenibacillus ginsengarvi TaxID=400777 RepID=A0A3B0CK62_9BACL|nr:Gfo/Idh/MocA family oxidoreductase [Paenibacillus ginsengarvi]RKN84669.1 gfo/Idh/MocA family oxidoreductase [Paenibacillus ginsengarvi]
MDQVRIGLIGTGNIAHTHVHRLKKEPSAVIAAISDPNAASRQALKNKFALEQAAEFENYADMLEQSELDAVIICSPHTLHYRHASDALAAGKHVLVEKPLTCTSAAAERLIAQADKAGKVLQVSFQRHFLPAFMYIRQAIAEGAIGPLTSVTATLYQDWKDAQQGTWRQNPQLSGGGMLMDSGSHIIDVLLWTTGLTPETVTTQLHNQGSPVEVDTFTSIRFAEGAVGSLNIIGKTPEKLFLETYAFIGEKGGIFYDNGKITLRQNGAEPAEPELPVAVSDPDRSFVAAILGHSEVSVPGTYAVKVLRLTESIYEAAGYCPHLPEDKDNV